jgi:prepilin-type N-terminal cleavage/methylation domain-containing protein
MTPHTPPTRLRPRPALGFTLMEVLISIGIFAIGMVAVAAVFPAAIYLQKQTIQDATSQQVARNAEAIMQTTRLTYESTTYTGNISDYYNHSIGHVQSLISTATNFGAEVVAGATPPPTFTLDTRSYPSYIATPADRSYFWYPAILDQNADKTNPLWVVYVFVMTKPESGTPDVYFKNVTPNGSDTKRLDFAAGGAFTSNDQDGDGTMDWLRAGDTVLDDQGNILQIAQADATGIELTTSVIGTPAIIYYGAGTVANKPNPVTRIISVPVVVETP